jgi:hypothetical protein
MDLAIKQVLRMSRATEGRKKDASNKAVFCIGLADFLALGSKHKVLIKKFVQKVYPSHNSYERVYGHTAWLLTVSGQKKNNRPRH